MIKAILLDLDDTIFDWKKCAHMAIKKAAEELELKLPDTVYESFDKINPKLWGDYENKQITLEEMIDKRFNIVFEEANFSFNGNLFEKHFKENFLKNVFLIDDAYETLEYLYSKYDVYAASNATLYQQQRRLSEAKIMDFFNDIFISEEIGSHKPHKEFYDGCMARMHYQKDEIIVIGDSLYSDITGAYNYGLKSIWFNRRNKEAKEKNFDYEISSLKELRNIL